MYVFIEFYELLLLLLIVLIFRDYCIICDYVCYCICNLFDIGNCILLFSYFYLLGFLNAMNIMDIIYFFLFSFVYVMMMTLFLCICMLFFNYNIFFWN